MCVHYCFCDPPHKDILGSKGGPGQFERFASECPHEFWPTQTSTPTPFICQMNLNLRKKQVSSGLNLKQTGKDTLERLEARVNVLFTCALKESQCRRRQSNRGFVDIAEKFLETPSADPNGDNDHSRRSRSQDLTTTLYIPQGSNPNDPNLEARQIQPESNDSAGGNAAR